MMIDSEGGVSSVPVSNSANVYSSMENQTNRLSSDLQNSANTGSVLHMMNGHPIDSLSQSSSNASNSMLTMQARPTQQQQQLSLMQQADLLSSGPSDDSSIASPDAYKLSPPHGVDCNNVYKREMMDNDCY